MLGCGLVGVIVIVISIVFQVWKIFLCGPTVATVMSNTLIDWQNKGNEKWIDDQKIFYIFEQGEGSAGTVICLHGFPTSSYDWKKMLPDLKKEFNQILLLDFLGFGFSDKPVDYTYTIFKQADIIENLAFSLQITSAHLLAHDYGDTVALELMARYNFNDLKFEINSLTMLNGGIFQETHKPRLSQKLLLIPVIGYITSQVFNFPLFVYGFGEIFGEIKPTQEDYQDFWSLLCYNNGHAASYKVINFLRERKKFKERWVGALKQTQVKVLFIYGPADPVNPPEFISQFRKTVPGKTIVSLSPDVGHYPQWESPREVTRAFITFLKPLLMFVTET
ncbi:mesoderm-specific transcript protein-like [Biomphalaria glabrata]|uniref:Mesoderm-specific transcript protein-like n=1 Tax=Biomphalaria glabrata TaxID=6526 RepID=A0A9U8DWC0_BIOGL|nr:mesoderm-specific transcript protein-like [Biomphalaria glabrata]